MKTLSLLLLPLLVFACTPRDPEVLSPSDKRPTGGGGRTLRKPVLNPEIEVGGTRYMISRQQELLFWVRVVDQLLQDPQSTATLGNCVAVVNLQTSSTPEAAQISWRLLMESCKSTGGDDTRLDQKGFVNVQVLKTIEGQEHVRVATLNADESIGTESTLWLTKKSVRNRGALVSEQFLYEWTRIQDGAKHILRVTNAQFANRASIPGSVPEQHDIRGYFFGELQQAVRGDERFEARLQGTVTVISLVPGEGEEKARVAFKPTPEPLQMTREAKSTSSCYQLSGQISFEVNTTMKNKGVETFEFENGKMRGFAQDRKSKLTQQKIEPTEFVLCHQAGKSGKPLVNIDQLILFNFVRGAN